MDKAMDIPANLYEDEVVCFMADVIHGYETIFPIPLALSCSWDTLAVERMARISAIEASADGINWTFSPMIAITIESSTRLKP
jgi:beta-glucosidase-like glycosyl hydrolase